MTKVSDYNPEKVFVLIRELITVIDGMWGTFKRLQYNTLDLLCKVGTPDNCSKKEIVGKIFIRTERRVCIVEIRNR